MKDIAANLHVEMRDCSNLEVLQLASDKARFKTVVALGQLYQRMAKKRKMWMFSSFLSSISENGETEHHRRPSSLRPIFRRSSSRREKYSEVPSSITSSRRPSFMAFRIKSASSMNSQEEKFQENEVPPSDDVLMAINRRLTRNFDRLKH